MSPEYGCTRNSSQTGAATTSVGGPSSPTGRSDRCNLRIWSPNRSASRSFLAGACWHLILLRTAQRRGQIFYLNLGQLLLRHPFRCVPIGRPSTCRLWDTLEHMGSRPRQGPRIRLCMREHCFWRRAKVSFWWPSTLTALYNFQCLIATSMHEASVRLRSFPHPKGHPARCAF